MISIFFKDVRSFFSDIKAVLLVFLLPILLISFFVFAFGGPNSGGTTSKAITLYYTDQDSTSVSKSVYNTLDTLREIHLVPVSFTQVKQMCLREKPP